MIEGINPILLVAEALRTQGGRVESDDGLDFWRVDGGEWISDVDLLVLVLRHGAVGAPALLH
ncbi:hypothetical protein [Methylobacterium sp. 1973]|uniref:hypothetical protein n=1 Tax=Methylobacterium sp. 1973 TaxID=3156421 RepID=UPI0033913D6A